MSAVEFAGVIAGIAKAIGAKGDVLVADGARTVVFLIRPATRKDAGLFIGRGGKMRAALQTIAETAGQEAGRKLFVVRVENKRAGEEPCS